MNAKQNMTVSALAVTALGIVLMFSSGLTIAQQAFAVSETSDGVDVLKPDGYTISTTEVDNSIDQQSGPPTDNNNPPTASGQAVRSFKGHSTDSLVLIGYFNVGDVCNNNDNISVDLNGGPHNSQYAQQTDAMKLEVIQFDADTGRLRTLPVFGGSYSSAITPGPVGGNPGPELDTETLCATGGEVDENGNTWVGVQVDKLNVDSDSNGSPDHVAIQAWVDKGGIDSTIDEGCSCTVITPANDWVQVFDGYYTPGQLTGLDSVFTPEIKTAGHPELQYQTFRVDSQRQGTFVEDQYDDQWFALLNVTSVSID